ncbi:hypothetical protein PPL19_20866 [Pseudomonas psychrotolerans L19]|uniref:DUF1534 domain-containing protein n=1 Tax=Pseudomonas oryzihabitans TaxID=47885 RepID=A0ABX3ITH3_9PSED|nr:hypothetical protein PPL19_20866 [Pseudomonas psychrotolerans L19]KXJ33214.1 hypothetical protein AX284_08485 [Pseudomonas sp. HUK17]MBA1183230.1 hypothetical protein [Pseudomonas psychrotolerans]NMZ66867.1 hypothetical protein [Pseudomonas oryzihabitans]HCV76896.1 hypothetical protein [Pseudomonas sp.]
MSGTIFIEANLARKTQRGANAHRRDHLGFDAGCSNLLCAQLDFAFGMRLFAVAMGALVRVMAVFAFVQIRARLGRLSLGICRFR